VCGYSTVFQRGASPCFILKESSSSPKVIDLGGGAIKSLTRFHTSACQRGFAYIDAEVSLLLYSLCIDLIMSQNTFHLAQLPSQTHYGHLGWATQRYPMGSEIHALSYHPRDLYIVGTGQPEEFSLPEDTYHYEWAKEGRP
jgi:cleavage and polyadenylation specificity factor subunit 1